MAWARIDDGFHGHPKTRETSLAARGLFATALSFCADYLTDGELPASFVRDHAGGSSGRKALRELTENGWVERANEGGFRIAGYLEWNPSREQVEAAREKERRKKADHRAKGRQQTIPWAEPQRPVSPVDSPVARPSSPLHPIQEDPQPPPSGGSQETELLDRVKDDLTVAEPGWAWWLAPLEGELDDDRLTLRSPHAAWVRARFVDRLAAVASEAVGRPIAVLVAESDEELRDRAAEERKTDRAAKRLNAEGGAAA